MKGTAGFGELKGCSVVFVDFKCSSTVWFLKTFQRDSDFRSSMVGGRREQRKSELVQFFSGKWGCGRINTTKEHCIRNQNPFLLSLEKKLSSTSSCR